jgi:hypothetical protein
LKALFARWIDSSFEHFLGGERIRNRVTKSVVDLAFNSIVTEELNEFCLRGSGVRSFSWTARAVARRILVAYSAYCMCHDCFSCCMAFGLSLAQLLLFCCFRNPALLWGMLLGCMCLWGFHFLTIISPMHSIGLHIHIPRVLPCQKRHAIGQVLPLHVLVLRDHSSPHHWSRPCHWEHQ